MKYDQKTDLHNILERTVKTLKMVLGPSYNSRRFRVAGRPSPPERYCCILLAFFFTFQV